MKRYILLLIAANGLLLAGCCAPNRAAKWEYKTVVTPNDAVPLDSPDKGWISNDEVLNTMINQGWRVAVYGVDHINSQWFLLKRPKK